MDELSVYGHHPGCEWKGSMPPLGVIEGFYGRVWSWQQRHDMVAFLSKQRFASYWYAPKADTCLRKCWHDNWDDAVFSRLQALSSDCRMHNIHFGIGLSPLGLYDDWRCGNGRDKLLARLQQIIALQPAGLALLFDDMQGDLPGLAQTQADIAHFVAEHTDLEQLVLCPSYYSFDPVLEQLFGRMTDNYWADLGALLDPAIDIFWTGDRVISMDYPPAGLDAISTLLRRQPVLWDNSIVNDGRKTSPFLAVRAMFDAGALQGRVKGIMVNPMNAPALSQIALASLQLPGTLEQRLRSALAQQVPALQAAIVDCLDLFTVKGREHLDAQDHARLYDCFHASNEPVAQDIMAWLDGAYRFDPACLT